jgi:hypothetical protein
MRETNLIWLAIAGLAGLVVYLYSQATQSTQATGKAVLTNLQQAVASIPSLPSSQVTMTSSLDPGVDPSTGIINGTMLTAPPPSSSLYSPAVSLSSLIPGYGASAPVVAGTNQLIG